MTTAFYESLRDTAARLIADKGRTMTLRSKTAGSYSTSSGAVSVTSVDTTVTGVVTNYPLMRVDGTLVQRGDLKVLTVSSVAPKAGDGLYIGTVEHDIIDVREVNPGGTVVVYAVQARRGG